MTEQSIATIDSNQEIGRYLLRLSKLIENAQTSADLLNTIALAQAAHELSKIKGYGRQIQATALSLVMTAEARLVEIADKMKADGELRGPGRPPAQPASDQNNSAHCPELSVSNVVPLNSRRLKDARTLNKAGGAEAIAKAAQEIAETPGAPVTRRAIVTTAKSGKAALAQEERDEKRLPWRRWFWSDWRSDMRLRFCSLAARGLWAEMLGIMDQANPVGYLVDEQGKPLTARQIAVQAAAPGGEKEVVKLIDELEGAGVFSRNGANVIYSRRVVRDEQKAKRNRENGLQGGNPDLSQKQGDSEGSDNPHMPDARVQNLIHTGAGEDPDASGKDLLGEPLPESGDEKYALTLTTPIPEPFIKLAITRAAMSAGEAQSEWSDGMCTYWAPRGNLKNGKKTTDGWLAAWRNYVTGSICQNRLAAQRRARKAGASGPAGANKAPGKLDALQDAIDRCEEFDRAGAVIN